jgi:hypothetical protein
LQERNSDDNKESSSKATTAIAMWGMSLNASTGVYFGNLNYWDVGELEVIIEKRTTVIHPPNDSSAHS